jgi:hypothetical protein
MGVPKNASMMGDERSTARDGARSRSGPMTGAAVGRDDRGAVAAAAAADGVQEDVVP